MMKQLFQNALALPRILFGVNQPISKSGYRILCFCLLATFLLLWQFTFPYIIPKLDKIWLEFLNHLYNNGLVFDLGSTLSLVLKGMFFSVLVAFFISYLGETTNFFKPIAVVFEKFRFWSLFGFSPVIRVLAVEGDLLRLYLVMFAVVPFMVTSFNKVLLGVRRDPLYDYAYTLGFSELRAVFYVVFRSRLRMALIAIGSNFAIAWLVAPSAEVASRDAGGIGAMLYDAARFVPGDNGYAGAFALQFVILGFGIFCDYLFGSLRKVLPEERAESKKI